MPFAIYLDLECLLKKNNLAKIILKNLTQRKMLYMSLLVGQCLQDVNRGNYFRGKDCNENCIERAMKIINHEKKKKL